MIATRVEILPAAGGHRAADRERRAGRRVALGAVVHFDDLGIVFGGVQRAPRVRRAIASTRFTPGEKFGACTMAMRVAAASIARSAAASRPVVPITQPTPAAASAAPCAAVDPAGVKSITTSDLAASAAMSATPSGGNAAPGRTVPPANMAPAAGIASRSRSPTRPFMPATPILMACG